MHEMGIVLNLARTIDEIVEEQDIEKVAAVVLEVGEVSGIMTDLFMDAWDYFKPRHPYLAESELRIEKIPAVTYCSGCGTMRQFGTERTVRFAEAERPGSSKGMNAL